MTPRLLAVASALVLFTAGALSAHGPRTLVLPNRLTAIITEDLGRPVARARLRFALSPRRSPPAAFALEVLDRSATGSHSRGSFDRALDHAGLSLRRSQDAGSVTWELVGPPQSLDTGLALLADQVMRLQLDGTAVERARLRLYRDLQGRSPSQRALLRTRARLGAAEGSPPDEALLSLTGEAEIEAFLRDLLRPGNALLSIEGALTESQASTAAFLHFGAWPDRPGTGAPTQEPDAPRLTLVPGGASLAWLGLDLAGTPAAFRELLALAAPRTTSSGADLEVHPSGFALRRSGGNPLESLGSLQADLAGFAMKGLSAPQFEAAQRRHAAAEATLGLHPADAEWRGAAGRALSAEIAKLDLETFNGLLRKAFAGSHPHAVLVGLGTKAGTDPRLEAFGEPEVWFDAKGAFVRRAKGKPD
jgi:hypothetical protein